MSVSRCHHGTIIQESWMECPECWAEHEANETASQIKEQTDILKKIAYQKTSESSPSSPIIESQEFARLANERFKIDDTYGAIQLISKAIIIYPSFPSFYIQRANYYLAQDSSLDAIADIKKAVIQDSGYYTDLKNRISSNNLSYLSPIKNEISSLLNELKDNARQIAKNSLDLVKIELEKSYKIFTSKKSLIHIEESKNSYNKVLHDFSQDAYLSYLKIPESCKPIIIQIQSSTNKINSLQSEIANIMKSYSDVIKQKGKYTNDIDIYLTDLEVCIRTSKEQATKSDYPAYELAKSTLDNSKNIYEIVKKEINSIDYKRRSKNLMKEKEKREDKDREAKRSRNSIESAKSGALIFSILGSLSGCVNCNQNGYFKGDFGGFNFLTGGILGIFIGAILGYIFGFIKKVN